MADLVKTTDSQLVSNGTNDFAIPRGYICTFDISTIDGKIQLATALNGAISMRDKVGEILRVTDVVTTQGIRSRTDEECTNTYLICDDGTVYFSQSEGVLRSVKVLVATFTNPSTHEFLNPVELGVGFKILEDKLDNGNTLKKIVPAKLA